MRPQTRRLMLSTLAAMSVIATPARLAAQLTAPTSPLQPAPPVRLVAPVGPSSTIEQPFTLAANETTRFGFGVTRPGPVVVDLSWQGVPIAMTLRNEGAKKVVATTTGNPAAARLTYTVTDADVVAGKLWTLTLAGSGQAGGKVRIVHPTPDAAALKAYADGYQRSRLELAAAARAQAVQQLQVQVAARIDAARVGYQRWLSDANARTLANAQSTFQQLRPLALPAGARLMSGTTSAFMLPKVTPPLSWQPPAIAVNTAALTQPRILSVTPLPGGPAPGNVLISTTAVTLAPGRQEVWFTIGVTAVRVDATTEMARPIVVQGRLLKPPQPGALAGSGTMEVEVPFDPSALVSFSGSVFVRDLDRNVMTAAVPFSYTPPPVPIPDGSQRIAGWSEEWLELRGANFSSADECWFVMPAGENVRANTSFVSATLMKLQLPRYSSAEDRTAYLYMKTPIRGSLQRLDYAIATTLRATIPSVASVTNDTGGHPRAAITIYGRGLKKPYSVHVLVNNVDLVATITDAFSDDRQITATLPDFAGIAGPISTTMFVQTAAGKTPYFPIALRPELETRTLDMGALAGTLRSDYASPTLQYGAPHEGADPDHHFQASYDYVHVWHAGGYVTGSKGDDQFFVNFRLKNNWVVNRVVTSKDVVEVAGDADAGLLESRPGTSSPYVKVHWWVTPTYNVVDYHFTIVVEGPRGFSYL